MYIKIDKLLIQITLNGINSGGKMEESGIELLQNLVIKEATRPLQDI